MLTLRCPECGKPAPIALGAPDSLSCDACGFVGAPDPDDAARAHSAANALLEMAAESRQLRGVARRALQGGVARALVYVAFAVALLLPVGGVTAVLVSWSSPLLSIFVSVPLLMMLFVFGLSMSALRRRMRQLEDACAAQPPRAEGEPARCHMCGGPLDAGEAIVRCEFCRADNLVSDGALARIESAHEEATDDLERAVTRRLGGVSSVARGITLALAISVFAGPVLMCLSLIPLVWISSELELALDPDQRVAFVVVGDSRCIGELLTEPDRLWFGGRVEDGYLPVREDVSRDDLTFSRPESLVGMRVRAAPDAFVGVIDRVFGVVDGHNSAAVVSDAGEERRVPLAGLCAVPD